jgi:hypothetical protein
LPFMVKVPPATPTPPPMLALLPVITEPLFMVRDAPASLTYTSSAVYDVFASPIKETVGFQGLQKREWSGAWEA